eukprot:jgi/Tetstr1/454109/TSEL_041028.t1
MGTVKVAIWWRNVDGESDEVVRVEGTCGGMTQSVVAEWTRRGGKVVTRFSAPVDSPAVFLQKLLETAERVSVPPDSRGVYAQALGDMGGKLHKIARA